MQAPRTTSPQQTELRLEARIKEAFGSEPRPAYADNFMSELLTGWRESEKGVSRSLTLIVITSLVAILVGEHQVKEFSVLGARITETRWLSVVLPAVVAYLYSSLCAGLAESLVSSAVIGSLTRTVWPAVDKARLHETLYPSNMSVFGPARFFTDDMRGSLETLSGLAMVLQPMFLVLGPLAVEGYLLKIAFSQYGSDAFVWISAVASTAFSLNGLLYLMVGWRMAD